MYVLDLRVTKYIPSKSFGFCQGQGIEVFFHSTVFDGGGLPVRHIQNPLICKDSCPWDGEAVPAILGEKVRVYFDFDPLSEESLERAKTKALKASRVERLESPLCLAGKIDCFSEQSRYGFVNGEDGESYHLHTSELREEGEPSVGQYVQFISGVRKGKPRACYVKIL